MASMLEQAIIDATELREAAFKNAETAVIEKYSDEIKEAVTKLLEQPEEEAMMDPMGLETEPLAPESEIMDDIPGVEAGGCAPEDHAEEDESEIVLNIGEIEQEVNQALAGLEADMGTQADLATDVGMGTEPEVAALEEEQDEEISLDEEQLATLAEIVEELHVDLGVEDANLGGRTTPTARIQNADEVEAAALQDSELAEENEELKKAVENLDEKLESLQTKNNKYLSTIKILKEKLEKVNLSNARLLYTNRVLNSSSLNERQKVKIVESISQADSVEEAKVIFETLQSAVGAMQNSKGPKSLREAVEKPSTLLPRKQRNANVQNSTYDRMRALAGIKK